MRLASCMSKVITEIMIGSQTNEVIEKLFKSLLQRYQEGLEESMKASEFAFDGVNALYYDLNNDTVVLIL